jgi:hypothetical protein
MVHQKSVKKKSLLLWIIIFSHLLPIIVSAFYDKALHAHHEANLTKWKYWWWFFTWWSAWASLLTIPWAFYKLFTLRRKKSSYGEQMSDLIITETNLVSGIAFCGGGFLITIHTALKHPQLQYPLIGEVGTIWVWIFYNFFWHVLAPGLVFYFFWKHSRVDKLAKQKKLGLVVNLFAPTIYLLYVIMRPWVSNFSKPYPHSYPRDYPYAPFFWIAGKQSSKNGFHFWHNWSLWLQSCLWLAITIAFWYVVFSFLFFGLVKLKNRKRRQKLIIWK